MPETKPERVSRKVEALEFISGCLIRTGRSPSMGDIAGALKVSRTRAKHLVHQLATDKMIERAPGAQRAISVPGLERRLAVERLRAEGYVIDEDVKQARLPLVPFPQEHLPLVAVIEHVPDVQDDGEHHGEQQDI